MLENYNFIDLSDYRKLKVIGVGSFGTVFRIQEKTSGKIYAAKIFKDIYFQDDDEDQSNIKQIIREAALYSSVQHPAIARYYGLSPVDFEEEPYPCLILEYYTNKSLRDAINNEIQGNKPDNWNKTKILINIYGIASGISYLHSKNILYRDLNADNILEDFNFYPKLCDFGCIKDLNKGNNEQTVKYGSPLYMAPEIIEDNNYSPASDVYSFGILVYKLLFKEIQFGQKLSAFRLFDKVKHGERPEFTKPIPNCYKNLITRCWSQDPKDRPSFNEIVEILKSNREFVTEFDVDENEFNSYVKMVSGEKQVEEEPTKDQQKQLEEIIEDDDQPLSIQVESIDLNKFTKKRQIGEGSFGVVYEVENKTDKTIYAAKISKSEIYECLKKVIETVNLIREVTILSKIDHPGIIKFIGFSPINFKKTPKPVIITELLQNGTLEDIIELERKGLSNEQWDETKKLINIYGIASSMAYLHSLEILHRDLKPANILVDEFLFPKLADFGLSKDQECELDECQQLRQTGLVGTPIYIAPEIYSETNYTKAGDVYAFGFIVYEIMTSEVPSVGKERYQLMCNIMNGIRPSFNTEIPKCYKNLIENCWDRDPNKRPSFDEIVYELKNNPEFITDLVVESEYLDYVDMIDNKTPTTNKNFKQINIKKDQQQQQQEKCQNISSGKGFINIDDYKKLKRKGKNEFWKFYDVVNKTTNKNFAAKMSIIPIPNLNRYEIDNIIKEVNQLIALDHPTLMKFYGYSSINFKHEIKPVIITEKFEQQTLLNIIEMNRKGIRSKDWDLTQILINIYGIASGMKYLHSKNILHNDLKPSNIFIDVNLYPKISDYGFYTKLQILKSMTCQSSSRMQNTPNYSSPEVLNSEEVTKASDVYSFALIVFEMLTKKKPFSHLETTTEIIFEVVGKEGRPEFPEESESDEEEVSTCFRELIEKCWSQKPEERPTFENIVQTLKNDPRFVEKGVDRERFFSYVEMIDNNEEENKNRQKINENENEDENENKKEKINENEFEDSNQIPQKHQQDESNQQLQQERISETPE